jgi:hypothetical protein
MKEKFLMLLTMVGVICLSAFTPSKEKEQGSTDEVKKTRPTVIISYPSEFTRFISMQLKKSEEKSKSKTMKVGPYFTFYWWDFNGNVGQQGDPYYYSKDPDNFPECLTMTGNVYCEVRAQGNSYDDTIPELSSVNGIRYRPLQ